MHIKIYLPTYDKYIINNVAETLTSLFKGCTVIPNCVGYWLNPKTKHIEQDKITIVEVYTDKKVLPLEFSRLLMKVKRKLNQQLLAYTKDNKIYFK